MLMLIQIIPYRLLTFNGKNNQPRKRSTNSRSLNNRVMTTSTNKAMVATGGNPSVTVNRAPTQPPPVPSYKDKWVKRVYSATKTSTSPAVVVDFTVNDFGLPADTVVYVDKVQVWNLTAGAKGVETAFKNANSTDLGNDDVVAQDYSSLGQCPGVTYKVPLGHAKGVSNTTVVVSGYDLPKNGTGLPLLVAHLHCWVAV